MKLSDLLKARRSTDDEPSAEDAFSTLILAARDDDAFRQRLMVVLRLPAKQRESMIRSAVAEMTLRGESAGMRAAFSALSTKAGAEMAERLMAQI